MRYEDSENDIPIRSKTTTKYREMYDTIDWGDDTVDGDRDTAVEPFVESDEDRRHDAACAKLTTEGADCDCGAGDED